MFGFHGLVHLDSACLGVALADPQFLLGQDHLLHRAGAAALAIELARIAVAIMRGCTRCRDRLAVFIGLQQQDVGRGQRAQQHVVAVVIQARVGQRHQDMSILFQLEALAVQLDVQVAHLHGVGVDDQVFHLAGKLAVGGLHVPAANIRVAIGNLVMIEVVQPAQVGGAGGLIGFMVAHRFSP